jgi:hypothetical protein
LCSSLAGAIFAILICCIALEEGKAAGSIRNQRMLDAEKHIDVVVAFPGGRGTADMVRRARAAGIHVLEIK